MTHLLDNNRMLAVQIGGMLMILAGVLCYFIVKEDKNDERVAMVTEERLV
jgi:maltose/moltooligosaccharide transporter